MMVTTTNRLSFSFPLFDTKGYSHLHAYTGVKRAGGGGNRERETKRNEEEEEEVTRLFFVLCLISI
jgi:hypothetical protein